MCVEQSGSAIGYRNRVAMNRVSEIRTDFGHQSVIEREAIEDVGDEGGSPAESLGENDAVADENIVAVVAGDQAAAGGGTG